MMQEILTAVQDVPARVVDAFSFYFSSVTLIAICLVCAAAIGAITVVSQRRQQAASWEIATIGLSVGARMAIMAAMLVAGGALAWSGLLQQASWERVWATIGVALETEGVIIGAQIIIVGVVAALVNWVCEKLLSEARMGELIDKMRRPNMAAADLRVVILLCIDYLVVTPLGLAFVLLALHLV